MKNPKTMLKNISIALRSIPTARLEEDLLIQKNKLKQLEKSSKENYDYLSVPILDKIKLIENELKNRECTANCN